MQVRSTKKIAEKWKRITSQRAGDYEYGIKNPKKDWAIETEKSEGAYEQGIQESINDKRFGKGVRNAGTKKWQHGAVTKGVQRFGPGVMGAEKAYEDGFSPFADTLRSTDLPQRFAKGDPRNIERVIAVDNALHQKKLELKR